MDVAVKEICVIINKSKFTYKLSMLLYLPNEYSKYSKNREANRNTGVLR